eukprot:11410039-Karenia_brevis.AAC.1
MHLDACESVAETMHAPVHRPKIHQPALCHCWRAWSTESTCACQWSVQSEKYVPAFLHDSRFVAGKGVHLITNLSWDMPSTVRHR